MQLIVLASCIVALATQHYVEGAATSASDYQLPAGGQIVCPSALPSIRRDSETPILRFTPEAYANFDFGVYDWKQYSLDNFPEQEGRGGLAMFRKKAWRVESASESDPMLHAYDYVVTLHRIEREKLLEKPFIQWSLEDIKNVNKWLTDLRSSDIVPHPGEFRTYELKPVVIKPFTKKQKKRLRNLSANRQAMTVKDVELLRTHTCMFPTPNNILSALSIILCSIKTTLLEIESRSDQYNLPDIINTVGFLHRQIATIRPWPKRNKATARILGNIMLMQYGRLKPVIFSDEKTYREILDRVFRGNDYVPLSTYIYRLIVERQQKEDADALQMA
jgi:hypothetical protein